MSIKSWNHVHSPAESFLRGRKFALSSSAASPSAHSLVQTTPSPILYKQSVPVGRAPEQARLPVAFPDSGEENGACGWGTVTNEKLHPLSSTLDTQPIQIWFGWTLFVERIARRLSTSSNLSPLTTAGCELLAGRPFGATGKIFPLVISPTQAWTSEP